MKKIKKVRLSVAVSVIAVVMAVGLVTVVAAGGSIKEMIAQVAGQIVGQNISDQLGDVSEESFGAMPGNELPGPEFIVGGNGTAYLFGNMKQASTTLCSFKNPISATTTIQNIKFQIAIGTTTASTIVIATSSRAMATSTLINLYPSEPVPASTAMSKSWNAGTSTPILAAEWVYYRSIGSIGYLLGPDDYLLFITESAGLSGYRYKGTCSAILGEF